MTLDEVQLHRKVIIKELQNVGRIRRRLLDLGIMPESVIEPVLCSPSGHMRSYFIKGTMIALRDDESTKILVQDGR